MENNELDGRPGGLSSAAPMEPSVPLSPPKASIPDARTMRMEWSTNLGAVVFSYPSDLSTRDIEDVVGLMEITLRGMRRRASVIEAGTAETAQTGSVHESAGPQDDARKDPS